MSMSEDYLLHLEAIKGRSEDANQKINMPVSVYVAEAETLYQVCLNDEELLKQANLNWAKVEILPTLSGAVRQAQSLWNADRFDTEKAQEEWDAKEEPALDHIAFCLNAMGYAYRDDEHLLGRIDAIREGRGAANLVQDLNDTAVLGTENSEPLAAINFDLGHIGHAAILAEEMSDLLARKESSSDKNERKTIRDKAYSWLKEIVDEIYACGQYVFWKDEDRKNMYRSAFRYEQNRRNYLKSKQAKAALIANQ